MQVLAVDCHSQEAPQRFTQSLKETGFAVLHNHPIEIELIDKVYAEWEVFFNSESKSKYLFNKATQDGFFPQSVSETAKGETVKDIKEFFQIYPWGQYPKELSQATRDLYNQLNEFAQRLLSWIEANTPAEISKNFSQPLSSMINDSELTMLRVLHYPPFTGSEEAGAIRAAAHEDINLITLLCGSTESGLQVQDVNGSWHDVSCDRGAISVNIGDMLQEASKHYFPSTTHRVINPEGTARETARMSMPLFLHPKPDVVLSKDYTAGSYLQERLRELGLKD